MSTIPTQKLDRLVERWQMIQAELNAGPGQVALVALSKEFADLDPIVRTINALRDAERERDDLDGMLAESGGDPDMADLARQERDAVGARLEALERRLTIDLLPKDAADERSAILEVRPGTGGDEAALFAADLFRMYSRYAELRGWKVEVISLSESDLGGLKEVVASVSGKGVFARLKFESGVHRVQRVPATEASGRIHTSAATVAVLPEAEEVDVDIKPEDIRIDTMRASGPGGRTSTKRNRLCASCTCRPASWSWPRRNPSIKTGAPPCRCCARASTNTNASAPTMPAPALAKIKSAPAIGPSASAPTISPRGASAITGSI